MPLVLLAGEWEAPQTSGPMSVSMLLLIAGAQALVLLPAPCVRPAAQRAAHPRMQMRNPFENMANPFEQLGNPFEALLAAAAAAAPVAAPKVVSSTPKSAAAAVALLTSAAETKAEDSQAVIDALLKLEKTMRAEAKTEPRISAATLAALDGAWRLVFTTGTIDTQKKAPRAAGPGHGLASGCVSTVPPPPPFLHLAIHCPSQIGGTISYFPFKAVQTFDTSTSPMSITNGIYVGDYPVVQFFGPFEWKEAPRKLTFDFDYISVRGPQRKSGGRKRARRAGGGRSPCARAGGAGQGERRACAARSRAQLCLFERA